MKDTATLRSAPPRFCLKLGFSQGSGESNRPKRRPKSFARTRCRHSHSRATSNEPTDARRLRARYAPPFMCVFELGSYARGTAARLYRRSGFALSPLFRFAACRRRAQPSAVASSTATQVRFNVPSTLVQAETIKSVNLIHSVL